MNPLDFAKSVGGPGSIGLLILLSLTGLFLWKVWPRRAGLTRAWFALIALVYLVLALPFTAEAIDHLLPPASVETTPGAAPVETLVVFDGDNRRGRLASALSLWTQARPARIVVSGQAWLIDRLIEAGVPAARVERDAKSRTTREQVDWLTRLVNGEERGRVAVIVSRLQAPRVKGLLDRRHVSPLVIAAPLDVEPSSSSLPRFIPSYSALRLSRDAFYEYVALRYYRWRGWIDDVGVDRGLWAPAGVLAGLPGPKGPGLRAEAT